MVDRQNQPAAWRRALESRPLAKAAERHKQRDSRARATSRLVNPRASLDGVRAPQRILSSPRPGRGPGSCGQRGRRDGRSGVPLSSPLPGGVF
jgi:hypothetical protein